jgi:hypothetical protein
MIARDVGGAGGLAVPHVDDALCQADARQIGYGDDHGLPGDRLFGGQVLDDFLAGPSLA